MFIKSISLKNFKCFAKENIEFCIPDGTLGSGLNILVGENNSGKSSLFEAIYFIRNKATKDVKKIGVGEADEVYVDKIFCGELEEAVENFVQPNKKQVFKDRIFEEKGEKLLRVKKDFRNSEEAKKILFYNKDLDSFNNEVGIDAPFQKFFQISNIWADTNPEDETKFGATTICGNLLADISEKFKIDNKGQLDKFLDEFHKTFNDDKSGLQKDLNEVAHETEIILNDQFGDASLRFKFDNPEPSVLFKNIKIYVNDGEETEITEKGHGMQRAVILSLLQVYARRMTEIKNEKGEIKIKPHFLFIDEPEMGLHPQAQIKLFEALKVLSQHHQIFISTHSENFVSPNLIKNIYKFKKENGEAHVLSGKNITFDLGANRKFFMHHHKLFFTNKAIFVEGVDDMERYPLYCEYANKDFLKKDIFMLGGCGDYSIFRDLCDVFDIDYFFLFDLDVISINNQLLKKIKEVWDDILKLNISIKKKDPSNLLDCKLSQSDQELKHQIIKTLTGFNIFVLPEGNLELYLEQNGKPISKEREKELNEIFNEIASKYSKKSTPSLETVS